MMMIIIIIIIIIIIVGVQVPEGRAVVVPALSADRLQHQQWGGRLSAAERPNPHPVSTEGAAELPQAEKATGQLWIAVMGFSFFLRSCKESFVFIINLIACQASLIRAGIH